jgi:tetratricopeptide (TPR) repeat protein
VTTEDDAIIEQAQSAMKAKRWSEAIALFNREPSIVANDWKSLWNLGWCHYKLGKFSEAGRCFRSADAMAPENADCKWARGVVYLEKRNYKKAERFLLESLRLRERLPARAALVLAYLAQGKVALAEKVHLDGIATGTRLSERYKGYAAFLSDVGRKDEADQMRQEANRIRSLH